MHAGERLYDPGPVVFLDLFWLADAGLEPLRTYQLGYNSVASHDTTFVFINAVLKVFICAVVNAPLRESSSETHSLPPLSLAPGRDAAILTLC